ncbi:MAG: MnhB domain-containing protein [Oscillospiraceae bacterium]
MKTTDNGDLIVKCLADKFTPIALVLGFYVILHGNISPGGGFQGGVLVASSVLLLYLAYGFKGAKNALNAEFMHKSEAIGAVVYIVFALLGIFYGFNFCRNVFFSSGKIGEIWSSGTIALMNYAVGFKVLTGMGFLLLLIIGLLSEDEPENEETTEGGEAK